MPVPERWPAGTALSAEPAGWASAYAPKGSGLARRVLFGAGLDRGLVDTHRFQGGQASLLGLADVEVPHAVDDALEFRPWRPEADPSPQYAHTRRWFLRGHRMPLVLDDELAVGSFQYLHPQSGVAGTFCIGQQLQDPPLILHRVVPGDLAGVPETQDLGQTMFRRHQAVGRFWMLGLHVETGVETRDEVLQHRRGLVVGPGIRQVQFGDQPILIGLCPALHPAFGLG